MCLPIEVEEAINGEGSFTTFAVTREKIAPGEGIIQRTKQCRDQVTR